MKTIFLILILISLPTIGEVANLDRSIYLRLIDGYSLDKYDEFIEGNKRYANSLGISYDEFLQNIYEQFIILKDNNNDGTHDGFLGIAIIIFGDSKYYQASDIIRDRYLLPSHLGDVENDYESQTRELAALAYIKLDPEDLLDVSKVILTSEKRFLFFERIAYCEALIEYLQKTDYRSNSRASTNRNDFINLIVTEIDYINKKDNSKTIFDVKKNVVDLDKKLSDAVPEYRNSNAREIILRNVTSTNRLVGTSYPEVDTRLAEIEAIHASSRTNLTIKTKAEWKAEIE